MAKAIAGRVYAQIRDSKVHWIFTADDLPEWAEGAGEFEIQTVDITDLNPQPKEGWDFDGKNFTPPAAPLVPVPQEVTRFQARAALYQSGLLQVVEDEISKPETDMMLKLAWQDAQTFKRGSSFVTGMASILNLTEEQIDDLFILAAGIE